MGISIDAKRAGNPSWLANGKKPVLIAGPCSVESEDQFYQTAKLLAATGKVDYLRGGIWKPRTKPGTFEGIGAIGLPWMKRAKEEFGIPIAVEVAKASHVALCLEFDVDLIWIGARTTVNPFAVQEIADVLKGTDKSILIKNPINADLSLWIGGVERLLNVGLTKIGAIHRGFSAYGEKVYRNKPQWQIPLDFKKQMPDVPMICDPSHICGVRELLQSVSQKALDLGFDGLMLESHINPDKAWSDASQQVTPERYVEIINSLILRESHEDDKQFIEKLDKIRHEIDNIDDDILELLGNRMKLSREIGQTKKENNVQVYQKNRWQEIVDKLTIKGEAEGLSPEFVKNLLDSIHQESINQQENIMQS